MGFGKWFLAQGKSVPNTRELTCEVAKSARRVSVEDVFQNSLYKFMKSHLDTVKKLAGIYLSQNIKIGYMIGNELNAPQFDLFCSFWRFAKDSPVPKAQNKPMFGSEELPF